MSETYREYYQQYGAFERQFSVELENASDITVKPGSDTTEIALDMGRHGDIKYTMSNNLFNQIKERTRLRLMSAKG